MGHWDEENYYTMYIALNNGEMHLESLHKNVCFLSCQPKKQYFLRQTFSLCNVQTTVDITPICSYRNNIMEKLGRQENLCIWICISYSKFKSQLEMQYEITKANSQFRFLTKFFSKDGLSNFFGMIVWPWILSAILWYICIHISKSNPNLNNFLG